MTNEEPDRRSNGIRKAFSAHGFGFHYAVIKRILDIDQEIGLEWRFLGAEVPLSLKGSDTHADFIFHNPRRHAFLIGECKRSSPRFGEWCFARTKYSTAQHSAAVTIDELVARNASDQRLQLQPLRLRIWDTYQVGLVVKVPDVQSDCVDGIKSDRDAIAEATSQVQRAANGFMHLFPENGHMTGIVGPHRFITAVFTTADLLHCRDDLSIADLASGSLPTTAQFVRTQMLWFQHALTRAMQADVQGRFLAEQMPDWPAYFDRTAIRSTAIVSQAGIRDFLTILETHLPSPG